MGKIVKIVLYEGENGRVRPAFQTMLRILVQAEAGSG